MNRPTKENEVQILIESMLGSSSQAILNQEKRGQNKLVNSDVLPHKFNHCTREDIENMGIIYLEEIDDLFSSVSLPDGWRKRNTDHSMWSNLIDEKGRVRANIFYKAASYDRDAFISPKRRFSISTEPVGGWDSERPYKYHSVVRDCEKVVFASPETSIEPDFNRNNPDIWREWLHEEKEKISDHSTRWLQENYPNWEDYKAYWD